MTYFKATAAALCLGLTANAGHAEPEGSAEDSIEPAQTLEQSFEQVQRAKLFQKWREELDAHVEGFAEEVRRKSIVFEVSHGDAVYELKGAADKAKALEAALFWLQKQFPESDLTEDDITIGEGKLEPADSPEVKERISAFKAEIYMDIANHAEGLALAETGGEKAVNLLADRLDGMAFRLAIRAKESTGFDPLLEVIGDLWNSVRIGTTTAKSVARNAATGTTERMDATAQFDAEHSNVHDALWEHLDGVLRVMDKVTRLERWGCRTKELTGPPRKFDAEYADLILTADHNGVSGLVEIKGLPPFKAQFYVDGLDRRWSWDFSESMPSAASSYAVTIRPDRRGNYYEFPAEAEPGARFKPRANYECTSYTAVQPDPEPSPENQ